MPVDRVLTPKKCPFISEGVDTSLTKSKRRRKKILTDKVKEYIKKLGAPKLTKAQIAIIKDHHEFHGDKKVKIVGSLPGHGVFVRCFNHQGCEDSVVYILTMIVPKMSLLGMQMRKRNLGLSRGG